MSYQGIVKKRLFFRYSSDADFRFRTILDDLQRERPIREYYDIYGEDLDDLNKYENNQSTTHFTTTASHLVNQSQNILDSSIPGNSGTQTSRIFIKHKPETGYGVGYQIETNSNCGILDDTKSHITGFSSNILNNTTTKSYVTTKSGKSVGTHGSAGRSHGERARSVSPTYELTFCNPNLVFDVFLDDDLIYSKTETGRFPLTVDILIRLGLCGEKELGGKGIAKAYFDKLNQKSFYTR